MSKVRFPGGHFDMLRKRGRDFVALDDLLDMLDEQAAILEAANLPAVAEAVRAQIRMLARLDRDE